METLKTEVRKYWNQRPCEAEDWRERPISREYFDAIARHRYAVHPYIPSFARFDEWRGRRVLELGVGAGSDFCRWIQAGACGTGVDLTSTSIRLTRANLKLRGLAAELLEGDLENLPFAGGRFDLCYSFGVIHHTPDVERAIREVHRVLRPGGQIRIMLYHIRSWVTLRTYLEHGLLAGRPLTRPERLLASNKESPGTKAYTRQRVLELFRDFADVTVKPQLTTYDVWDESRRKGLHWKAARALWPRWAVASLGDRFGWNLLITGTRR